MPDLHPNGWALIAIDSALEAIRALPAWLYTVWSSQQQSTSTATVREWLLKKKKKPPLAATVLVL